MGLRYRRRETVPALAKEAQASGGEVYVWDASGFRADAVPGKTGAVKGPTPVVERPAQRPSIRAAAAVNASGACWFCLYQGGLNGAVFIPLPRRMMRPRAKPVHWVVDGLAAHRTALVKA